MQAVIIAFVFALALFPGYPFLKEQPMEALRFEAGLPAQRLVVTQAVTPLSSFKYDNVVRQRYDYSCGAAALAMMLAHHGGDAVSEGQVIRGLLRYGELQMIRQRRAFSLLDMKLFVNVLGYEAIGYRLKTAADLEQFGMPCIVAIKMFDFRHFVVFRGIAGDRVLLADPSQGNITMTVSAFEAMWVDNVAFLVYPENGDPPAPENGMTVTMNDLRFMDADTMRRILFEHRPGFYTITGNRLESMAGRDRYYRIR